MTQGLLEWGGHHPRLNRAIGGLLNPSQPEFKTLLILAILLIAAAWLFLGILEDVVTNDPLVRVDQGLYQILQELRSPWGDRLMVFVTELGDSFVIASVAAMVLAWLLWRRNWHVAGYWAAAVGFGQIAATLLKLVLQRPRPLPDIYHGLSTYAFPSGHAVMSTVVYGFLAVLIARHLPSPRRWMAYALAALLIVAIALSRLYLGAHWLSDVLGGMSLGLAWVCLLGIAYYRHTPPVKLPKSLSFVGLLALTLAGGWHVSDRYSADLLRYAPPLVVQHMESASWWQTDWRNLPAYRRDLDGEDEQPFNLRWSGKLTDLADSLRARGWRDPVPLSAATAMRWLLSDPALAELPLLPQVHDGRHEALLMLGPAGSVQAQAGRQLLVLRLWRSDILLDSPASPLWIGSVTLQRQRHILFLHLPVMLHQYEAPIDGLIESLVDINQHQVKRSVEPGSKRPRWDGRVLLLRDQ